MKLLDYLYIKNQFKKLIKKKIKLVSIPAIEIKKMEFRQYKKIATMCLENNVEQTFNNLTFEYEYRLGD